MKPETPSNPPASETLVAAQDVDALYTDPDPKLHANKQVVYRIQRDLIEAGQWELADRYLTERYIQHNPNIRSGRAPFIAFFKGLGFKTKPVPEHLSMPVIQVIAQGDYVIVASVSTQPRPDDASKTFSTTWFDMFLIKDGKADEHWDSAPLFPPPA